MEKPIITDLKLEQKGNLLHCYAFDAMLRATYHNQGLVVVYEEPRRLEDKAVDMLTTSYMDVVFSAAMGALFSLLVFLLA